MVEGESGCAFSLSRAELPACALYVLRQHSETTPGRVAPSLVDGNQGGAMVSALAKRTRKGRRSSSKKCRRAHALRCRIRSIPEWGARLGNHSVPCRALHASSA